MWAISFFVKMHNHTLRFTSMLRGCLFWALKNNANHALIHNNIERASLFGFGFRDTHIARI